MENQFIRTISREKCIYTPMGKTKRITGYLTVYEEAKDGLSKTLVGVRPFNDIDLKNKKSYVCLEHDKEELFKKLHLKKLS